MLYRKVVVLDSVIFFPEHRDRIKKLADTIVEYTTTRPEEVEERCQGADCIISCWVDIPNSVIDQNPQLKTIAFWTHDFEHRIDWRYARARGIYVPSIPDYGTDSVAEVVFIALLQLLREPLLDDRTLPDLSEPIFAAVSDDVRRFSGNVKDALNGRWLHEYVKAGQLQIKDGDDIGEETLKGLTVGIIGPRILTARLSRIMSRGFGMNVIYTLTDYPHELGAAYRPMSQLLAESHVLIYDSRALPAATLADAKQRRYLSEVDVSAVAPRRASLVDLRLGIIGLGRIGSRVAQIGRDGFGMKVGYFSRTRKPQLEQTLDLQHASLVDILTTSDVISIHLPHHGAENYLTDDMVAQIPNDTIVVNASVGSVFSREDSLLRRFGEGTLRGYLDVYKGLPPRHLLRKMTTNLLATYRLGWRTKSTIGLKTHKLITKLEDIKP